MKIVLSAGHNPYQPNYDSGSVGQGQQEALDYIRITDRIAQYLTNWNIDHVVMPHNVGNLSAEQKWVNDRYPLGSAYAIQIHRNAGGGTGNEVWTTAFQNQIPLAKAILAAMTEAIYNVRPFIAGLDAIADRNDIFDTSRIGAIVLTAVPGCSFGAITMDVDGTPDSSYQFDNGEIPFLDAITYV
jgi:hypothetical protein